MKSYGILFFVFFLISCGKSGGSNSSQNENAIIGEVTESTPIPNAAYTWDANIQFVNFTRVQEEKVLDAVDLIKQVIASEEFKSRVLNYKYKGKKTFVDNGGLTNSQIYAKILEASETLVPGRNNTMDVTLETYTVNANVVGYTLPSVNKIWMNTNYLNKFTPVQVTGNLVHEWLHKLGFNHSFESTPSRPYSVPYAVGYLIKSLAAKYY